MTLAAAIPQIFRGEVFPSKSALKAYLTEQIYKMPLRSPLEGLDRSVVDGILELHHNGAEKIGCGVSSIEVRISVFGEREIWLRRTDGSDIDVTWAKVMDGPKSDRTKAMGALREAIRPQIRAFRREFFLDNPQPKCAITGSLLRNDQSTHIDHQDPYFVEIADAFIERSGGLASIAWGAPRDTSSLANMTAQGQIAEWLVYHREHSVLRATASTANLTRPRTRLDSAA